MVVDWRDAPNNFFSGGVSDTGREAEERRKKNKGKKETVFSFLLYMLQTRMEEREREASGLPRDYLWRGMGGGRRREEKNNPERGRKDRIRQTFEHQGGNINSSYRATYAATIINFSTNKCFTGRIKVEEKEKTNN